MVAALATALAAARVVLGTGVAEGQSSGGEGEKASAASTEEAPRPGRVKLVYSLGPGTRGCDDEAFFRRMVASELEVPDPFVVTGTATHDLEVHVQKDAPGFRATVKLRAAGKEIYARDFLERTCADAVDRAVIVSMLTVFPPARQTGPPAATASPTASPAAAPPSELERRIGVLERRAKVHGERLDLLEARLEALEKVRTDTHTDTKEKRKKMDITWALSAGALITANLTPDVGPGVWLGGGGRSGPISVELEARVVLPSRVRLGQDQFDLSQFAGFLVPCGRYSYFFGCAVAGAGTQLTYDAAPKIVESSLFYHLWQFGGRLGAEIPFGDSIFGARAWGEVLYSTPHTFSTYPYAGTRWDRPDVSAFFGVGLVVKLNQESTR